MYTAHPRARSSTRRTTPPSSSTCASSRGTVRRVARAHPRRRRLGRAQHRAARPARVGGDARRPRVPRAHLRARSTTEGFEAECVLAGGDPADEIAAAAEREQCDLIAMSTHGHRFIDDLIYGSVANAVRHQSLVPVLLVARHGRRLAEPPRRSAACRHRPAAGMTARAAATPSSPRRSRTTSRPSTSSSARRGAAGTNDLAQRLDVAPASVSGMVRRLAEQGLHRRTSATRACASPTRGGARRCARSAGTASSRATSPTALGYPWDRVHDEAERLEHAASDELIDRMAAAIGEPAVDPHGAPIPTREGAVDERRHARARRPRRRRCARAWCA